MRKEAFTVGSFVHVFNRGNRKQIIVRDKKDKWHFLQMLYYFNNKFSPDNIFRQLRESLKSDFNSKLIWPNEWPPRKPIVKILCFCLMNNHFHLLLKEIQEGGITMFMRKLGTGMTNYFNTKYRETGRLFQGAYKARRIDEDDYLKYLSVYIQVKNPFELLYGDDIKKAVQNFDKAFNFAANYPYCSLSNYIRKSDKTSSIINKDFLGDSFSSPKEYKKFAKECILSLDEELKNIAVEV